MAISVMTWVWNHSRSKHGARLTLLAIADSACDDGTRAWPSNAELQRKTGLGERAVQAAIAELGDLGELAVEYNAGPKGCNRYRVIMESPGPEFSTAPAESAPPQNLHPANNAPPQKMRGSRKGGTSPQVKGSARPGRRTPAESAPPQNSTGTPAESAPGSIQDPSKDQSSSARARKIASTADRLAVAEDDDDQALRAVIDFFADRYGLVISTNDARRVAAEILEGRQTRHRAAYVKAALRREPDPLARFGLVMPLASGLGPTPPPLLAAVDEHPYKPGDNGRCIHCELPEGNRHHQEAS